MKGLAYRLFLTFLLCFGTGAALWASGPATVEHGAAVLHIRPEVSFDKAVLRVGGPKGPIFEKTFGPDAGITYALVDNKGAFLPDGLYHYELVMTRFEKAEAGRQIFADHFYIRGGLLAERETRQIRSPRPSVEANSNTIAPAFVYPGLFTVGGKIGIGTESPVASLSILHESPAIAFEKTDGAGTILTRSYLGFDDGFAYETDDDLDVLTADTRVFTIASGAPESSFHIDQYGSFGFGTTVPQQAGHIVSGKMAVLRLETTDGGAVWDFGVSVDEGFHFDMINDGTGQAHYDALTIIPNTGDPTIQPNVGINTGSPRAHLEIAGDSLPMLAVQANFAGVAQVATFSNLLGPPQFVFRDESSGHFWAFSQKASGNGSFTMNYIPTAGSDFEVDIAGNAYAKSFVTGIPAAGAPPMSIPSGVMIANGFETHSSRELKTGFAHVDQRQVLDQVVGLPISSWKYQDGEGQQHLGPMAEDFWAAFGLGTSDVTLSASDVAGVSLAAIQGLYELVLEQQAELDRLKALVE